jgi:hypothetical protein
LVGTSIIGSPLAMSRCVTCRADAFTALDRPGPLRPRLDVAEHRREHFGQRAAPILRGKDAFAAQDDDVRVARLSVYDEVSGQLLRSTRIDSRLLRECERFARRVY